MPKLIDTPAGRCARELRKAGIPAKASKCGAILSFPTLGPDEILALRMLNPAVQKLTLKCGLSSTPKKK